MDNGQHHLDACVRMNSETLGFGSRDSFWGGGGGVSEKGVDELLQSVSNLMYKLSWVPSPPPF